MSRPLYPSLYQVNLRVWMNSLSRQLGQTATLDDIPDPELDRLAELGFDWIWLLSVWQTGLAGQQISRSNPDWRHEFLETLPDLTNEDIAGSGFAITAYKVDAALGGDTALARLRSRLSRRGLKLMLDFVPNHSAPDHRWVSSHPEYYIAGTDLDLTNAPHHFARVKLKQGSTILALGRDPYFSGWPDTLQLNHANPAMQEAMIQELLKISGQCDGLRCDMAMLLLPEIFERTWGLKSSPFWPEAIRRLREKSSSFCLLAEVYWDLESTLLQQGFDYAYDKRLYDRLREGYARPVREHLLASEAYQNGLARFLENHDETRAATAFPAGVHEATAIVTFLSPGLRFFHQGQFEGWTKKISPHLCRAPQSTANEALGLFYDRLLAVLKRQSVREGIWQLLECTAAWPDNWTHDCIIAYAWNLPGEERLLVAINLAANQSQCTLKLPLDDLDGKSWRFEDLLSSAVYYRDGNDLLGAGIYLDLLPWQSHIFVMTEAPQVPYVCD